MSKILIVVDMQNDFVTDSLGTAEARKIMPAVVAKIKEYNVAGDKVFYTRDTHTQDYMNTQEGRNLPVPHCIKDSNGWKLIPEVAACVKDESKIFDKPTFGSKELAEYILENESDVEEIELIGVCTDICVVSNALLLKAYMPEMMISVDAKCCAGVTVEKHEAALETMRSCQINV